MIRNTLLVTLWVAVVGAAAVPATAIGHYELRIAAHEEAPVWFDESGPLGHGNLDPRAHLTMEEDVWELRGGWTSLDDGTRYGFAFTFSGVMDGQGFGEATDWNSRRIRRNRWSAFTGSVSDWLFAESIEGLVTVLSGDDAGQQYAVVRNDAGADYYAQFGSGLNARNGSLGLYARVRLHELDGSGNATGVSHAGGFAAEAEPVPEPSAALLFGLGWVVVGAARRTRRAAAL